MGDAPRADPGATPRIGRGGDAKRERPILAEAGHRWKVEVTPLPSVGRGGVFEVRAEFDGPALGGFEFGRKTTVRRIEQDNYPDHELAVAVATLAVELLRSGDRDLFLPRIAEQFTRGL